MKKLVALFVMSLVLGPVAYAVEAVQTETVPAAAEATTPAKKYFCPMDGFESDKPGKCEKCGMDLVQKVEAPEMAEEVTESATPTATGTTQQ